MWRRIAVGSAVAWIMKIPLLIVEHETNSNNSRLDEQPQTPARHDSFEYVPKKFPQAFPLFAQCQTRMHFCRRYRSRFRRKRFQIHTKFCRIYLRGSFTKKLFYFLFRHRTKQHKNVDKENLISSNRRNSPFISSHLSRLIWISTWISLRIIRIIKKYQMYRRQKKKK